ncbi:MAG: DegT/DnrJ/EryC1/StrS family aminotransferase [Planctomycetota bacterium]
MDRIPHSRPTVGRDEAEAASRAVLSGILAGGPEAMAFERELAEAVGRRHAVLVSSGHQALELWLETLGLAPGAAVRIPSYACAALLNAVERCGLKPQIEDVENLTLGLAPGPGTAIGANMLSIPCAAAAPSGETVLEDCAMGFVPGHTPRKGRDVLLSFYATKMLTTGQGAALLTDSDDRASRWRDRLTYDNRDKHLKVTNRSMTAIQAAMGRVQLGRYGAFLERRKALLAHYEGHLKAQGWSLHPAVRQASDGVLFRLPLLVAEGAVDSLISKLGERGIEAKRPVWRPLHRFLGLADKDYPVSVRLHNTVLSLPFYPSLTDADVARIVEALGAPSA